MRGAARRRERGGDLGDQGGSRAGGRCRPRGIDRVVEAQRPGQGGRPATQQVVAPVVVRSEELAGDLQERCLLVVRPRGPGTVGRFQRRGNARACRAGQGRRVVVLDRDLGRADPCPLRAGGGEGAGEVAVQAQAP